MIEETRNYQITILRYMDETDEDIDAKLARWRAGEDVPDVNATPTDGEELIVTIKQFGQKSDGSTLTDDEHEQYMNHYGRQRLESAVSTLEGPGTEREKLVNALVYSLIHIQPENLPDEMQSDFRQFMAEMTRVEGDQGSIRATVDCLNEIDVRSAIERILRFYDTVGHISKVE